MKRIVVIGGGSGIVPVLEGLKLRGVNVSAIVSTADDGGSSGILRKELGVLPPGAVRKPLLALSQKEAFWRDIFEYRFEKGILKGHPLGNIVISALALVKNDFSKAVKTAADILEVKGAILPVTLEKMNLAARLENGEKVYGETNIDIPKHNGDTRIRRIFLESDVKANPEVLRSLEQAHIIVIGPGDLYSSIIPNFLVKGINEAMAASRAKKAYITNLMTKYGETNNFSASQFFTILKQYCSSPIDYVLVNTQKPSSAQSALYKKEKSEFVEIDREHLETLPTKILYKNFLSREQAIRHSPKKLASTILGLP